MAGTVLEHSHAGNLETQAMMPTALQKLIFASLTLILFVAIGSNPAQAQGSSGGSIGNDDKSVSGSRSEGSRSVEPERPARRRQPEAEAPQRSSRRSGGGGGGGNFDGTWAFVGIGTNCQGTGSGTFSVSGGRVAGSGGSGSGSISPSGAFSSHGVGSDGISLTATGHMSGNSGGGTYMRSDGCGGRWSATRQ